MESGAGSGFFNTGGSNAFDTFTTLNGSLTLSNGASLTTGSSVALNGTFVLNSGATFTSGGLTSTANPLTIAAATFNTTSLPVDATNRLNLGTTLNLQGALTYTAALLSGLAPTTTVNVSSGGTLTRNGGNGWAGLADLAGTLDLGNGGTVVSNGSVNLAATGSLILESGGTLQVGGATFSLNPSGYFYQGGGTLILGGGSGAQSSRPRSPSTPA